MSDNFSFKIKKLRTDKKMTLEQVADIVGVGKSTVRKWETGMIANLRRDKIASLAKALGTTPAYLMGWEEETPDNILPIRLKKIPLLGEIAAGEPIFADQHYDTYVTADEDLRADFALKVKGDSMLPKIQNGDTVFIRNQPTVENGEIAAVVIEDEATLKRVYISGETITLISENADYPPFSYRIGEENIRILGKAVALTRSI